MLRQAMTTLFLLRHGLTTHTGRPLYGQTRGIDLDHRGRSQAEHLAARLAPVRPTAIYSSPLERCVQTVEPLASACKLDIIERDGLIEMHAGSWTGKPISRLRRTKAWRDVQLHPEGFRFPGDGESFSEARERAIGELASIAKRHRRGRVVVATHGDIVRVMLADLAGAPLARFQRIVIDTASISVATIDRNGDPRVMLVNDTGDLRRFGPGGGSPAWETSHERSGTDRRSGRNLRG